MTDGCISANSDLVGIGTRVNFYVTILLLAIIPEAASTTELTGQGQMDLYHALFVMQIIFSLNWVYSYGMRRFRPTSDSEKNEKIHYWIIVVIQKVTTVMFTIWLLYVWINDSSFGSLPRCNHLVKYVIFFAKVPATATWIRVLFIIYLALSACFLLFGAISFYLVRALKERWDATSTETVHHMGRRISLAIHPVIFAIYGVVTLELIVQYNRANIRSGEGEWGFGQIVSLAMIMACVIDGPVLLFFSIHDWYYKQGGRVMYSPSDSSVPLRPV